jgi:hypothetical protein
MQVICQFGQQFVNPQYSMSVIIESALKTKPAAFQNADMYRFTGPGPEKVWKNARTRDCKDNERVARISCVAHLLYYIRVHLLRSCAWFAILTKPQLNLYQQHPALICYISQEYLPCLKV